MLLLLLQLHMCVITPKCKGIDVQNVCVSMCVKPHTVLQWSQIMTGS